MGILLESYRQTIGLFQFKRRKSLKIMNNCSPVFKERSKGWSHALCLIFYLAILTSFPPTSDQTFGIESRTNLWKTTKPIKTLHHLAFLQPPIGLAWAFPSNNNKLCHCINGNRRNLGYKYFMWNCDRGILNENKLEDIKLFAEKRTPHIMAIIEINLYRDENNKNLENSSRLSTEQVLDKFKIEDYDIIFPDSWQKHNIARIVCYVHSDIKAKKIELKPDESHLQSILLEIGFGKSSTHFVNPFYREWKNGVTGKDDLSSQLEDLKKITNIWARCTDTDKDFTALGDINLCAKKWNEPGFPYPAMANAVKDYLLAENCSSLVEDYTRIRQVNGSLQRSSLDQIITNCPSKMTRPEILGIGKSDHLGVIITKFSKEIRSGPRTIKKRIYKNFDKEKFREDILKAIDNGAFNFIHETDNLDEAINHFNSVYNSILEEHAPTRIIQNRNNYVPYVSYEIKVLMKERNAKKVQASKSGRIEDFNQYKVLRNLVVSKMKKAKINYYREKFNDNSASPKDLWKNAYQILGSSKSCFPRQIIINNKLVSKPIEMATGMNNYFLNKIRKLKQENDHEINFEEATRKLKAFLAKKNVSAQFTLREINDDEVKALIKTISGKKSLGMDWICSYSLKIVASDLAPVLKSVINLSIRSGQFGTEWKLSKVLPGWKNKGVRTDSKFYRPISNLSELSKLCERAVHDQFYRFLMDNDLIHPNHYGFLKQCSTAHALQHIVDIWLQSIEQTKINAALFLDLSAGFDVINLDLLLHKLKCYNMDGNSLKWFESYLKGRKQCVQVESAFSPFLSVPWGVPQGSILGPLLFLVFINELAEVVKEDNDEEKDVTEESHVIIFADDNTPTTSNADPEGLIDDIQAEANKITTWFANNDMVCSGEKTKLLLITTNANRSTKLDGNPKSVVVNGEIKEESVSEKLLGLVINNSCTWKNHLYGDADNIGLLKELSKRVGVLKRLRNFIPDKKFRQIVNGIYTSKQIYGLTVFGGIWGLPGSMMEQEKRSSMTTKEDMRKMQVLQNSVMRIMSRGRYDTPTSTLLESTNQLSIHQLVAYHSANQIYNIQRNQFPKYHYNRLFGAMGQGGDMETRSRMNIESRVDFRTSLARGSFFYQGSRVWNALPATIKTSRNIESFKKQTRAWTKTNISIRP